MLARFAEEKGLAKAGMSERDIEDEFVYQNSIRLNNQYYASLGDKRAFVMSHARNLLIVKIVGYAEASVQYYRMPDMRAHVWIAHQRYPTKGRVWHPGGAHPFIGLNEALVHNGDFANYHSVSEYLAGRNIFPQFLTDTEVSVLLFDLWNRVYRYPIEYIIEALAPTTELDFDRLPAEKQQIYRQIQAAHIHASPDGPWFFIIARSLAETKEFQLLGITDTAMLRPQVFALQEGEVSIGLICSEKQAIDATLASLASEDPRFTPVADTYWNARGGSHTDGGAFLLTVSPTNGEMDPRRQTVPSAIVKRIRQSAQWPLSTSRDQQVRRAGLHGARTECTAICPFRRPRRTKSDEDAGGARASAWATRTPHGLFAYLRERLPAMTYDRLRWFADELARQTAETTPALGIEALTLAIDRRYPTGDKKRSSVLTILRGGLEQIFQRQPLCDEGSGQRRTCGSPVRTRGSAARPAAHGETHAADRRPRLLARGRGLRCDAGGQGLSARLAATDPFQHAGHAIPRRRLRSPTPRACGSTATTTRATISAPASTAWRFTSTATPRTSSARSASAGKLVVYGDVGQTFLYGAKGGEIYVLGNAAGRPMINAVGSPRVVINGTALDFLAESFMAGDPHNGGGFAILNGLHYDPYAGSSSRWNCPIRAATCFRWPPAGRSTSAIRIARWSMSNSTAGRTGRFRPPIGN